MTTDMNSRQSLQYPFLGKGRIELILGPMFSGKTTELIRRITRFQIGQARCIVIKYEHDKRYSDVDACTHDQRKITATSASTLMQHLSTCQSYDVIGIDEGQFFPDLIKFSEELANAGKTIVVAALDGTFERVGFGDILQLVPLAESVIKLSAVCLVCYGDASFTQRLSNDRNLEIIGGAETYRAVCRECFRGIRPVKQESVRQPGRELDMNVKSPKKQKISANYSSEKSNGVSEGCGDNAAKENLIHKINGNGRS